MSSTRKKRSRAPKSTAEWVSLAFSLIILFGFVGAILWLWIKEPTGPPEFQVERGVVAQKGGLFHLPVIVTNVGGSAAGEVRVEGKLSNKGSEESTGTTIDFLPVRAREEVVLIFRGEPAGAVVQVISYRRP